MNFICVQSKWLSSKRLLLLVALAAVLPVAAVAQSSMATCLDRLKKDLHTYNFNAKTQTAMCNCVKHRNQNLWPSEAEWPKKGTNKYLLMAVECGREKITAYYAEILEEGATTRLKKKGFTPDEIKSYGVCAAPEAYMLVRNMEARPDGMVSNLDKHALHLKASECESRVVK